MFKSFDVFFESFEKMFKSMEEDFRELDSSVTAQISKSEKSFKKATKIDPNMKSTMTKTWTKDGKKYTLTIEG